MSAPMCQVFNMELNKHKQKSAELTFLNTGAHDQKFVVNKNVKDLETLRKTFKPQQSSVLSQVRDFLPKLAAANEDIQRQFEANPLSVNVENVEEGERHVEMNIALVEQSDVSESTDDSDSDDDVPIGEVTADNLRLPKQGKCSNKVLIECCTDIVKDEEATDKTQAMNTDTETDKT